MSERDAFKKLLQDFNKIEPIIDNNNVETVVLGLPLNKDGTKGRQAQSIITFASNLNKKFSLPILMWDERFSTVGIEREMINTGLKKKNIKKLHPKVLSFQPQSFAGTSSNPIYIRLDGIPVLFEIN